MCAYKITLQLLEGEDADIPGALIKRRPARYIPRDQDYVDVSVPYQATARFYYPVDPEESGDLLIFANKTAPIGKNGNASLLMNVQTNSSLSYLKWSYARNDTSKHTIASRNWDPIQPEMIDICQEKLREACSIEGADCSLMISVFGESEDYDANIRLRVFNGTNKLYPEKPIHRTHSGKGSFKYFWFLSKGAMDATEAQQEWQHTIAMGIKTYGADFDLYVSVMDGRYPTQNDHDFKSTNFGADSIFLTSDDAMFQHANSDSWDPSVGMVVVVGVQALQDTEAEFSLYMNGP